MAKRNLFWLLSLLLLFEISYSFIQHFHKPLDGDLASFVLPNKEIQKILDDPFAIDVLVNHSTYTDPNRFFSHWFISFYFKNVPLIFQKFINPVDSIYLSCAVIKTIVQVLIIYILTSLILGVKKINKQFIMVSILIAPLFQATGWAGYMGIIDQSITYFFFYALPFSLLLVFLRPFYFSLIKNEPASNFTKLQMVCLAVILPFSGPLITGIILIVCLLILSSLGWNHSINDKPHSFIKKLISSIKNIPIFFLFIIVLVCTLSLYSLYIGTFNSVNNDFPISIAQRYLKMPIGLLNIFTQKIGMPLLLIMGIFNSLIIKFKYFESSGKNIITFLKWIMIFCILYLTLLPLGGYRFYRPNIIRFDTFMPVTICLIVYFGVTTYFLINRISSRFKTSYLITIVFVLLIFTVANKPNFKSYFCERKALEEISLSKNKTVLLSTDCTIMSWRKIKDAKESEMNSDLLLYWGVIKEKKLYYQN